MKKIFHFECNIFPEDILIRELTDGEILISEDFEFSIYLKKEKNDKFEFIQKIDVNNCDTVRIPIDGITHNYFIIEKDYTITIFEKKTNLLNQKKELYNKKYIIDSKNSNIKGLFLNDNLLITYYKDNDLSNLIIFEEKDINENCKDIKQYTCKHKLFNYEDYFDLIKLNSTYLLINDDNYLYFFNYELKQFETIIQLEPNSKFIFSRINQDLIFIKDNIIKINKLNIKTFEVENIKEINIPNVFENFGNINCVYSEGKLIYSISCLIYNESDDEYKNIAKLFIID
jgi:hypothetical protein